MGLEIFLYRKTYLSQEYVTLNEFSLWEQGMRKISLADTSKVERSHCSAVSGAFWTAMVKANYCKYVFWPIYFYLSTKTFPTIVVEFIF